MTALVVEVVVTADLAVKHSAMSPGKLEDTITHTHAHARADTHARLNSLDGMERWVSTGMRLENRQLSFPLLHLRVP